MDFFHIIAGLTGLRGLSCAGCAGFTAAAVQAIGGMHSLVEVNLRGWMPHANVQALTALQTLHGEPNNFEVLAGLCGHASIYCHVSVVACYRLS